MNLATILYLKRITTDTLSEALGTFLTASQVAEVTDTKIVFAALAKDADILKIECSFAGDTIYITSVKRTTHETWSTACGIWATLKLAINANLEHTTQPIPFKYISSRRTGLVYIKLHDEQITHCDQISQCR